MSHPDSAVPKGAMSVEAFCRWASIGRTAAYREIAEGRLQVRKLGRRTLVPLSEAERWLNALPNHSSLLGQLSPRARMLRLASRS
jgi:hypothetical protein